MSASKPFSSAGPGPQHLVPKLIAARNHHFGHATSTLGPTDVFEVALVFEELADFHALIQLIHKNILGNLQLPPLKPHFVRCLLFPEAEGVLELGLVVLEEDRLHPIP